MRFVWIGLALAIVLAYFLWPREGNDSPVVPAAVAASEPAAEPDGDALAPPSFEPLRRDAAGDLTRVAESSAESQPSSSAVQHEILVLDQDRKPVAGIQLAGANDLDARRGPFWLDNRTDAAGRGRVQGLEPGDQRPYFVRVGFLGPEPIGARLPADGAEARPVEIVLPAYGSIRVEVVPEISTSGSVSVTLDDGERRLSSLIAGRTPLEAGAARLSFIGLNQRWVLSLTTESGTLERRVPGPTTAGEEIVVRFEHGADPVLTGLLLDESGAPLRGFEFNRLILCDRLRSGSSGQTDAQGRFWIPLRGAELEAVPRTLELRRILPDRGRGFTTGASDPASAARAALPDPLPHAEIDLGEVRFAAEPVLVSGRVIEPGGEAIANVVLFVEELYHTSKNLEEHWDSPHELSSAVSGPDGSFVVYGPRPERAIRLRPHEPDYERTAPILLQYGETGLEVKLARAGGFDGHARWEQTDGLGMIQLGLLSQAGEFHTGGGKIDRGAYTIKLRGLTAGTYDFVGRIEGENTEFLRLAGIVIRSGEVATDPRVQDLDLGLYLDIVTVAPRDGDGRLPYGCKTMRLRASGARGYGTFNSQGAQIMPIPRGGSVNLLIEAPGLRSHFAPRTVGELRPVLEPTFLVTVRVLSDSPFANAHGNYSFQAVPLLAEGYPKILEVHASRKTDFKADGRAEFEVDVLGGYELQLLVPTLNKNGNVYPTKHLLGRVEIGSGDSGKEFTVELPETLR